MNDQDTPSVIRGKVEGRAKYCRIPIRRKRAPLGEAVEYFKYAIQEGDSIIEESSEEFQTELREQQACFFTALDALCEQRARTETVTSHSEREIVNGSISLIKLMVDHFKEYLDWRGIKYPADTADEEYFSLRYTYGMIVNRLLLYGTSHSGGTSTAQKCRELGFDYGDTVTFEFERENEE